MTPATQKPSESITIIPEAGRPSEEGLREWLTPIEDPELRMSLSDLGLIYHVRVADLEPESVEADRFETAGKVRAEVDMTLTTPTCPAAGYIVQQVKNRLLEHPGVADAEVKLVWEPKWNPKEMASEEAKEVLGIW